MDEEKSAPALRLVIPMPIALYSSNGLLFELYDGGQPCRRHQIVWEKVENHRDAAIHQLFRELYPRLIADQPGSLSLG